MYSRKTQWELKLLTNCDIISCLLAMGTHIEKGMCVCDSPQNNSVSGDKTTRNAHSGTLHPQITF